MSRRAKGPRRGPDTAPTAPAASSHRGNGQPAFVAQVGDGVAADAEEERLAERDLPGEAGQQVEPDAPMAVMPADTSTVIQKSLSTTSGTEREHHDHEGDDRGAMPRLGRRRTRRAPGATTAAPGARTGAGPARSSSHTLHPAGTEKPARAHQQDQDHDHVGHHDVEAVAEPVGSWARCSPSSCTSVSPMITPPRWRRAASRARRGSSPGRPGPRRSSCWGRPTFWRAPRACTPATTATTTGDGPRVA